MSLKVAVMQPYFFPYAGYFRLFAAADIFVVFDCVQFPRRGWVHRNQLIDQSGQVRWLTLPLVKGSRDTTRICDLTFPADAQTSLSEQLRCFPSISIIRRDHELLLREILDFARSPVQYLVSTLQYVTGLLGITRPILLSSAFGIPAELKAQDRIIEITKRVGGGYYINAPGGRSLYDPETFKKAGISLNILPEYVGSHLSVIERLAYESIDSVSKEILHNTSLDRVI